MWGPIPHHHRGQTCRSCFLPPYRVGPGNQIQFARFDGNHLSAWVISLAISYFLSIYYVPSSGNTVSQCGMWWVVVSCNLIPWLRRKDCSEFQAQRELQSKILWRDRERERILVDAGRWGGSQVFTAKPDDLSSVPRAHAVQEESQQWQCLPLASTVCTAGCAHTCT